MEKKSPIFWMLITVITMMGVVNTVAAENQIQEQQSAEIKKYISRLRQEKKDFYTTAGVELKLRAEEEIRLLEVADKGAFAPLGAQVELVKTVLLINNCESGRCEWFEDRSRCLGDRIRQSPKRLALLQSRIAEKKSDILSRYMAGAAELEKQKKYALTVGLAELEKRLEENMLAVKPKIMRGVVTGIVHSKEKPSAIIDGQIVYEKDTINRARIVKIYKDKVELVKNGNNWTQQVQQTAAAFWQ